MFFAYYPIEGAIYTWSKLEDEIDGKAFVDFCWHEGINRIAYYIEKFNKPKLEFDKLAYFIGLARLSGIKVEALYDSSTDLQEVSDFYYMTSTVGTQYRCNLLREILNDAGYNIFSSDCYDIISIYPHLFKFDAVRVDYETFWEWGGVDRR